jgi:predicted component of type VI protein secretion system
MLNLHFFEEIEVRIVTDEKLVEMEKQIKDMNKVRKLIDEILNNPTVLEKLNSEKSSYLLFYGSCIF